MDEKRNSSRFKKGHIMSKEIRDKISETLKKAYQEGGSRFGYKVSEETKRRISEKLRGKVPWNKGVRGYNTSRKGKTGIYSKESLKKMSETRKRLFKEGKLNTTITEETRRKISEANKGKKRTKEQSAKLSKLRKGRKISIETRLKMSKAHTGEKAYNWSNGRSPLNKRLRQSSMYKIWRELVFLRDNFTCQNPECKYCHNKQGIIIHPHHIKTFSKYPELRFKVNNGITYCKEYHLDSKFLHKENILEVNKYCI